MAVYATTQEPWTNFTTHGFLVQACTLILEMQRRLCVIQQQLSSRFWLLLPQLNWSFCVRYVKFSHFSLLPAEAEAWGLLEAMKFALDNDMPSVIFESDCKVVVDIVNSHKVCNTPLSQQLIII